MSNPFPTSVRFVLAGGAFAAAVVLGTGTASAQDDHSGGVSPISETRDGGTAVAGNTLEREGSAPAGLPVTGSDAAGLAAIGGAAAAVGVVAVNVANRRRGMS